MPIRRNELRYTSVEEFMKKGKGGKGYTEEQVLRILQRHEDSMEYRKGYQADRQEMMKEQREAFTKVAEYFDLSLAEFIQRYKDGKITNAEIAQALADMKGEGK